MISLKQASESSFMSSSFHRTYNRDIFHGGDLVWAQRTFGSKGPEWIDLSTGINLQPFPIPPLPKTIWHRLPDSHLEKTMLAAARRYYGVSENEKLIACPGTQSVLQILPRLIEPTNVAIVSPTYAEHAKCWSQAGHTIHSVKTIHDISASVQIVVVVTPNNPTGTFAHIESLDKLRQDLADRGGLLILDEAFMDMTPEFSFCSNRSMDRVLILKSFGKFFGLAGLRLGFALGDRGLIAMLRNELGPWAVSGPAAAISCSAFEDADWISQTRSRLREDSQRLQDMLLQANLSVIGKTDLFTLIESKQAKNLFEHLCRVNILTRPFPDFPDYLRIGLPGAQDQWQRFEQALDQFKS